MLQTYEESRIEPIDLRQMWEPQEHLKERGLGYIQVNNEKWFYFENGWLPGNCISVYN